MKGFTVVDNDVRSGVATDNDGELVERVYGGLTAWLCRDEQFLYKRNKSTIDIL